MNTSIKRQLSESRHTAALDAYIDNTILDTADANAYAKAINDKQWAIVQQGIYNMDDAFVLAVEAAS